jgi:tetratricopeptide (TPR) repeat protein
MLQNEFKASLEVLRHFLERGQPLELQGEILAFMAIVKEKMGDVQAAVLDIKKAHDLSVPGSYRRYGLELTLGRLSHGTGETDEAAHWYLRAIETATLDPFTSGASAVEAFLSLKEASSWSTRERELCYTALRQAWHLFALPGEPALERLQETLRALSEASSRPLPHVGGKAKAGDGGPAPPASPSPSLR